MGFANRLRQLMESRNLQQKDVAISVGVGQSTVSHWLSGRQEPNPVQRMKLARYFKITEAELYGNLPVKVHETEIPIVSMVGATDDLGRTAYMAYEPPYKTINFKNCKAVRVDSNSMAPVAYRGQMVIYSEDAPVKSGALVFVKLKNGAQLFKRFYKNSDHLISLQSVNPTEHFEPIVVKEKDLEFCYKIVGIRF